MSEMSSETPPIIKVYKLRAQLGDRENSSEQVSRGGVLDKVRHNLALEFVDDLTDREREELLNDPSLAVYRRGVRNKNKLRLDEHVVTNTGGTLKRHTRALARPEGPRVLSAFARGSDQTWVAVKFAGEPSIPEAPIIPPKKIDLSKHG